MATGRGRRVVLLLALCLVTAAVGLLVSQMLGAPPGDDHGCPAGASAAACHYPPERLRWAVEWTIGGLVVGVALAIAGTVLRPLSPPGPGRRHLLRG